MQTETKRNKKQLDPLRFLKPKNRQSRERQRPAHQSPHFIKTLNAFPELSPRNQSSNKQFHCGSKQQLKLLPNLSQNNAEQNQLTLRNNALIKDKQYNPLRYFSSKVNDYMKTRNKSKENSKNKLNAQLSMNNIKGSSSYDNSFCIHDQTFDLSIDLDLDQRRPIASKNNEPIISSIYPSPQQFKSKEYAYEKSQASNIVSTNNNFKQISLNSNHQVIKNKSPEVNQYQNNQQWFNRNPNQIPEDFKQLLQCEHCGRKFNKQSYQKHNRICQKVFFQKRKQFDSLEKRSGSKGSRASSKDAKKR